MGRPTDIGADVKHVTSVFPIDNAAATLNGVSADRMPPGKAGGFLSALLWCSAGIASGSPTAQTVDCKLQDSSDDSTFADVTGETLTQLTADSTQATKSTNLAGLKRRVRLVVTIAFTGGSSPKWDVAAGIVLGGAQVKPAA